MQFVDANAVSLMKTAGSLLARIFDDLNQVIVPGMTTHALDAWIANRLIENGLVSQSQGYHGYRHVSCISINHEVVHGVPRQDKVIQQGDLVKVDVCAAFNGYCADMARCFYVGEMPEEVKKLVQAAQEALDAGIAAAIVGNRVGDISAAIQRKVEEQGFGVVRDFAGHGIGRRMHEEPEVLNYGMPGRGPRLKAGMALALEPMITQGNYAVKVLSDGWTAVTVDKSLAAHVEDTIVLTENGPLIVTRLR
jgi:methionyl aminopeptidase